MIFLILLGAWCFLTMLLYTDLIQNILMVDGSGFIYVAKRLDEGAILYKDVFITNTPLMPYLSWLYKTILFGNYSLFYLTSFVEISITGFIIFFIAKKLHNNDLTAFITSLIYLLSFTILSNCFPTGITTVNMLLVLSYLLYLHKKYFWTGVVLSLMVGVKAYSIPFVIGYIVTVFKEDWKKLLVSGLGFVATAFVYMLPTIIFAFPYFLSQTFGYGLVRGTTLNLFIPFYYFVTRDFLIIALGIFAIASFKKRPYPAFGLLSFLLFFLLFRDKHFLYYSLFPPFSALAYGDLLNFLKRFASERTIQVIALVIVCGIGLINIPGTIMRAYTTLPMNNTNELLKILEKEKPDYLYGVTMGVQGISYASGIPMIDNIADNNELLFQSGKLDRIAITKKILSNRTIVFMPAKQDPGLPRAYAVGIIDLDPVLKNCTIIHSQPFFWPPANELHLMKCYK